MQVLRGRIHTTKNGVFFRKCLVAFQFTLTILLVAATLLITRQITYMNQQELGYNSEQLLVSRTPLTPDSLAYVRNQRLASELSRIPSVHSMTRSSEVPGKLIAFRSETRPKGLDKAHNTPAFLKRVDHNYTNTFDIPVIAGRNFRQEDSSGIYEADNNRVMINRTLAENYGYDDPTKAVGQQILFKLGQNDHLATIVGVVENYHQRSLKDAYDPLLYYFPRWDDWTFYSYKLSGSNIAQTLAIIEQKYKEIHPDHTLDYFFLDEFFDRQYRAEQRFSKICRLMAGLAIFVACLGFIGLSALILGQRAKEIGVRKILGATSARVLLLLTNDFVKLILLANMICLPLILYLGREWLNGFAFNGGLGWQIFVLPTFFLLGIVVAIVSIQIYRSAVLNPILALKSE